MTNSHTDSNNTMMGLHGDVSQEERQERVLGRRFGFGYLFQQDEEHPVSDAVLQFL